MDNSGIVKVKQKVRTEENGAQNVDEMEHLNGDIINSVWNVASLSLETSERKDTIYSWK